MATAVERAVARSKVPTLNEQALKSELLVLDNTLKSLFKAEEHSAQTIRDKKVMVERDIAADRLLSRTGPMAELDMEVLRWRCGSLRGVPVPTLAPVRLDLGGVVFDGGSHASTKFPGQMWSYYRDVYMAATRPNSRHVSLKYTFKGLIPLKTKEKIAETAKNFEAMIMLVESNTSDWTATQPKRKPLSERISAALPDPIIAGWAADRLWVVDVFDATSVERYVLDEFTRLALPSGS